jgi:hypothetical protein
MRETWEKEHNCEERNGYSYHSDDCYLDAFR